MAAAEEGEVPEQEWNWLVGYPKESHPPEKNDLHAIPLGPDQLEMMGMAFPRFGKIADLVKWKSCSPPISRNFTGLKLSVSKN